MAVMQYTLREDQPALEAWIESIDPMISGNSIPMDIMKDVLKTQVNILTTGSMLYAFDFEDFLSNILESGIEPELPSQYRTNIRQQLLEQLYSFYARYSAANPGELDLSKFYPYRPEAYYIRTA